MKNRLLISIAAFIVLIGTGCNDNFLDRFPETSITEENFFQTASDLELYSNQFYEYYMYGGAHFMDFIGDYPSDNIVSAATTSTLHQMMSGGITPTNVEQWDWSKIRTVNFMIARAGKAAGDGVEHYIGLARLTRANLYYYEKVLNYSDVPWYSRDLQTTDEELLYKTQDPRALVVDSVIADLEYAANVMKSNPDRTLLSKEAALAYLARTALFEASWRKYHSELGLNDAEVYYQKTIAACEELMNSGSFSLYPDYAGIFRNDDLKGNPEMIFYQDYNLGDPNLIWWNAEWDHRGMFSRDLMESYLYVDGDKAVPYTSVEGYETKDFDAYYRNRDPRLVASFWTPGYQRFGQPNAAIPDLLKGGYAIKKFEATSSNQSGWGSSAKCFADQPILRYAEVLLNYAEAKAELGILTQADLDKSVNLLRDRAGMPRASLADWKSNVDPVLSDKYPNIQSSQKGAVLEIRRERRVELVDEGFRLKDLMRWGLGAYLEKMQEGLYFPGFGTYDLNANGEPDVLIIENIADKDKYADLLNQYSISVYALSDGNITLTEGTKGYIKPAGKDGVFKFKAPQYYYMPVSEQDMLVNPNLTQNKNWK